MSLLSIRNLSLAIHGAPILRDVSLDIAEGEIVAIIGFGESDNLAGATFAGFELATAQELFELEDKYSSITVVADEGTSPDLLRNSIATVLPDGVEAVTAADEAADAVIARLGEIHTKKVAFI